MASLTNVIMWMDNQWIPVTARKAIEIIPDGASVHSGFSNVRFVSSLWDYQQVKS